MPMNLSPSVLPPTPDGASERLRARRGGIIAFGVLSALLGCAALILTETATIASVVVIGLFMILAGVVEIGIGLRTRTWGRMVLWEAAGLVYLVAGLFAISEPAQASVVLTLLLGAGLVATGILRIVVGLRLQGSRSRGVVAAAGAITTLLGLLILLSWPSSSMVVLGTFLGIDLLLYGTTWIVFGYRLGAGRG